MYVEEDGITVTEIAKRLKCERTYLSRTFQKQHVIDCLARERKRYLLGDAALNEAARTYRGLLKSESDAIKRDVGDRLLTAGGALPAERTKGHGVSVSVGVQVGYVVNWQPEQPTVDVTPSA
jgi:hypothetical protein